MHRIFLALIVFGIFTFPAQGQAPERERTGRELYLAACAACHGTDGKGATESVVGFDVELPDFTECSFASPETEADWVAVVYNGGRARAFDRRMPAFGDLLTLDEISRTVDYVRNLCGDSAWPPGELNLPRPLVTEKAFPENEAVVTVGREPGSVFSEFLYEHRIGARSQYEVIVPYELFRDENRSSWNYGLGDIEIAFKHAVAHSARTGSILSAGVEMAFPTGKETEGLGAGRTIFAPFASYGQILPSDAFLHFQTKLERPITHEPATTELLWRTAVGRTWSQNQGFGRAWTPMVEFVAGREMAAGETSVWDVVPQMQVSLSTRQHILINAGMRLPMNDRQGRDKTFMVYFLWDWFDGGLFSGW